LYSGNHSHAGYKPADRDNGGFMKKTITVEKKDPLILLANTIVYSQRPYWCGSTANILSMSFVAPRQFFPYDVRGIKYPVIVFLCGGGFRQMDYGAWMGELAWFAKRGYAVASIQYSTDGGAKFPQQATEVKEAIRFLRTHANDLRINPDKIAIMGESAGAYLAAFTGLTNGRKEYEVGGNLDKDSSVQAVIPWYVPCNMRHSNDFPDLDTMVDSNAPPFLLLHGSADDLVKVEQSEILYQALEKAGVPVDLYIIEGANHGDVHFAQTEVKEIILSFLDKNLAVKR
jgi:acetyl esterase/lipase